MKCWIILQELISSSSALTLPRFLIKFMPSQLGLSMPIPVRWKITHHIPIHIELKSIKLPAES